MTEAEKVNDRSTEADAKAHRSIDLFFSVFYYRLFSVFCFESS